MRFFKVKYSIIVSCIVGFVLSGILAFAAPPDNFTATIVSQGMEMPMAKMGNKSRVENPAIKGVVTIVIADAKKRS